MEIRVARRIPNDPKVRARVRVSGGGKGEYDGWGGIELRGQSSLRFPKKSYGLELRSRGGDGRDVGLLGMPADDDWVLQAPYVDRSLMRNVVAYDVARWVGRWAAQTRFVEVWLNGRYRGVSVLTERPELNDERIDVPGEGVSGRYLVEMTFEYQARRKGPYFRTPLKRQAVVYDEPGLGDLSARESRYLRGVVARAERSLYRGRGWRRYLDAGAAVDYVLLQELFRNPDGFRASTYMVKPAGGRLQLGPIWDFDLAIANARGRGESPRGWGLRGHVWASQLHRDPAFRRALAARWKALTERGLRAAVLASVDRNQAALADSVGRNFRRWPVLDRRLWRTPAPQGSHRAEVAHLRRWLDQRMAWMDRTLR